MCKMNILSEPKQPMQLKNRMVEREHKSQQYHNRECTQTNEKQETTHPSTGRYGGDHKNILVT